MNDQLGQPSHTLAAPVDYRIDADRVAWITLNRPHHLNAITANLIEGIVDSLGHAGDDEARVVVLRGAGRAFCAGHDLAQDEQPVATSRAWVDGLQDITRAMRAQHGPVVAAVHGYALGGGFEFALAADLVLAARTCVFGFPEVEVGLSVTGGATMLLARLLGPLRAKQLLLLGERIGADEAQRLGLVNWVVEDDDLGSKLGTVIKQLLDKPESSMRLAKNAVDAGLENDMDTQLELEAEHLVSLMGSRDAAVAREAFRLKKGH
ncbi:MAG TPA: enoyl-CoA hydratase-related protein [Acidimicrobiales bacterium]|nr:enoyl-CoA hydratase-related protein [Acidimicrobiales bacterium]